MARTRKKNRTHNINSASAAADEQAAATGNGSSSSNSNPRSFVVKSGKSLGSGSSLSLKQLVKDMRKVMEPNTAIKLKERRKNKLKDFIDIAGPLGVTHLVAFSHTPSAGISLRVGRIPRGPTLSFKVVKYSLVRDVQEMQMRPKSPASDFKTAPLVVLNNFSGDQKQIKLMAVMFQNMFPPINVQKMKLSDARRVVMFNYNDATKTVDMRHYGINVKMTGVSKGIKSLLVNNRSTIPAGMSDLKDISEYVLKGAYASESDVEDDSVMQLPSDYIGKSNKKSDLRAIRLQELGPRLELRLVKIVGGMMGDGDVIFHEFVTKTTEEIKAAEKKRAAREMEKAQRREEQERNVEAKKAANPKTSKRKSKSQGDGDIEGEEEEAENEDDDDGGELGQEEDEDMGMEEEVEDDDQDDTSSMEEED